MGMVGGGGNIGNRLPQIWLGARASLLNAFTEGALTTFSGKLFQVSTTRLLNELALKFSLDLFFCSLNECPLVARY